MINSVLMKGEKKGAKSSSRNWGTARGERCLSRVREGSFPLWMGGGRDCCHRSNRGKISEAERGKQDR